MTEAELKRLNDLFDEHAIAKTKLVSGPCFPPDEQERQERTIQRFEIEVSAKWPQIIAEVRRLTDENARLREALTRIADNRDGLTSDLEAIALAALEPRR